MLFVVGKSLKKLLMLKYLDVFGAIEVIPHTEASLLSMM